MRLAQTVVLLAFALPSAAQAAPERAPPLSVAPH